MYEFDFVYGIRVDVHNGVFDVFALSDSYRNIIRKVADVLKIELTFGNQVYIDIIATVDMKSVTFEEFLYMAGRTVCVKGFTYEKTGNSYWIGNWINREK